MKLVFVVLLAVLSFGAVAQDKKPEHPVAAVYVAEGITALILGPIVLPAATLAGEKEALCKAMKGKYDLKAPDQCAGGSWLRLVPILRDLRD